MDEELRRVGREDAARGRRLRRRAGEDIDPAPGDLIRVTPCKGGAWSCDYSLHHVPFNVELLEADNSANGSFARVWTARCLEHDCLATLMLPYLHREFTYL